MQKPVSVFKSPSSTLFSFPKHLQLHVNSIGCVRAQRRRSSGYPPLIMANLSTVSTQNEPILKSVEPPQVAKRLENFKTIIYMQMSMLAIKRAAINLGQGFSNFDGPEFVKEAAIQAIKDGKKQYAREHGVPELNSAIASRFKKDTRLEVDLKRKVLLPLAAQKLLLQLR